MRAAALLLLALSVPFALAACVTKVEYVDGDGGPFECAEGFTLCAASVPEGVGLDAGASDYPVECVDLQRNAANCGACGNASCGARGCAAGKCGKCLPSPTPGGAPYQCLSDADCCSGACKIPHGSAIGGCE